MAGRHRKTPAWRRLLLRLRRSDRAARTAALQAEVVALRATVRALRAELDSAWASAAAATAAAAAATPAMAGNRSIELDLRPDTTTTEILLSELREIVLADLPVIAPDDRPEIVLAEAPAPAMLVLPEAAMLDPRSARDDDDVIDVREPTTASAAETVLPERRTA